MSEILGTLFKYLVALLGVGAVVLVLYQVLASNKTQNAISDMTMLQTNIQSLYTGQNNFTSLTNAVVIAGKLAPPSMISGANLVNSFNGAVNVNVNAANSSQFDMSSALVPQESCAKVIAGQSSAVGLRVNGAVQALPIDVGAAVTACNVAANTLVFTFAR